LVKKSPSQRRSIWKKKKILWQLILERRRKRSRKRRIRVANIKNIRVVKTHLKEKKADHQKDVLLDTKIVTVEPTEMRITTIDPTKMKIVTVDVARDLLFDAPDQV
jgi:hypothetical protein